MAASMLVAVLATAGCSGSSEGDDEPTPSMPVVPSSDGDSCEDQVGDLSADARAQSGTGTEPAGIDIVAASTRLDGDDLVITFTTAGPIDSTASPMFAVAQGNPFGPLSFEVRTEREGASGGWSTTLITWDQSEQRRSIVSQPTVDGATITWSIPAEDLPPLASLMLFGATAADVAGALVFDDCSALSSAPTVG